MSEISTGIDNLDRNIDGGIPEGYIMSLVAPSASDAERLLHQFASANSDDYQAVYVTTEQSESFLRDSFEKLNILSNPPQIVDITTERNPIDTIDDYLKKMPDESVILIDSIDSLEKGSEKDRYQDFLNELQQYLSDSDSTAILYGTADQNVPDSRSLTMKLSDVVFEVDLERQGEDMISYLSITKFRGIDGIDERIRLQIKEDEVSIDTSRDIS